MSDGSGTELARAAMGDQILLALASVVLCLGFAPSLLRPNWSVWARALWRVSALALLTLLVAQVFDSPLRPRFRDDGAWGLAWQQAVEVGWWIAAARSLAGVARLILMLQHRSRETQILSDLVCATVYLATALAIVDVVFAIPIGGVIATSGVIAVVIGLALQNTLADVFSGVAIDIERPYRAGDVLSVDGGVEGRVQEVNWRSTLIATGGDVAVVPNSVMAKARLVNHSKPAPSRRAVVEVRIDPRIMPDRCRDVLDAALKACLSILAEPAPAVVQSALRGDGAVYEIAFSVKGSDAVEAAKADVLALVQRHLFHAAIPLAVAGLAEVPQLALPTAENLLAGSDLFGVLAAPERDALASRMQAIRLAPGEHLFEQGEAATALYIVALGTIAVLRREPDGTDVHDRMSPGNSLGAIGLIADRPYAATATALTPGKAFRLDKAAIAAAIAERPDLPASLEELARHGEAAVRKDTTARREERAPPDLFLSGMRGFLRRLAAEVDP